MKNQTQIRPLIEKDIAVISQAFNKIGWNKPALLFEGYLKEQEAGERLVWVAHLKDEFAGYVSLKWQSQYPSFKAQNISEIMDLNVLPAYRKMGVGSSLLDRAEKKPQQEVKLLASVLVYMRVQMEAMERLKDFT